MLCKLRQERKTLTRAIIKMVAPHLHKSGFVDVRLTHFKRERKIRYPFSMCLVDGIMGFTQHGIITDAHGGGLMTVNYEQVCIEDLIKIKRLVEKIPQHVWK
jgi:hypothetical protein